MLDGNIVIKSQDTLFSSALIEQIRLFNAKRLLFQLPEGLIRPDLLDLVKYLKNESRMVFISGDACWGGCDLAFEEAFRLKCDLVIHYGHSPYPQTSEAFLDDPNDQTRRPVPVVWVEVQSSQPIQHILKEVFERLKARFGNQTTVGLVTNVQHVHKLDEMRNFFEKRGMTVYLGDSGAKTCYPGQILGCTAIRTQDDVDTYVYLGGGKFHGLSVALSTNKPVLHADPFMGVCEWLDQEVNILLKKRYAVIEAAREAKQWGIVVGLRSSQFRPKLARRVQEWLESDNREHFSITLRDITGERIMAFNFLDAFVVTACPRIPIDDSEQFIKPVLNVYELGVLLGKFIWPNYEFF